MCPCSRKETARLSMETRGRKISIILKVMKVSMMKTQISMEMNSCSKRDRDSQEEPKEIQRPSRIVARRRFKKVSTCSLINFQEK